MEIFLTNQINAEDFSFYFIAEYYHINKDLDEMEQNFEQKFDELSNLLLENKNNEYKIGRSLMVMYDQCDSFSPDPDITMIDEQELKDCAQILLVELQKE